MTGLISRFLRNRKGNFGMITAIAFPAVIASVALSVDVANTLNTKTELQNASDTAVLLAARYFKENRKQPPMATVQAFLDANASFPVVLTKLKFNKVNSEFTLESKAAAKTYLMGYFGNQNTQYAAISKASLGFSETLEFALALDSTGSMAADGKMDGLKLAAKDFMDTMFDANDRGANIEGSIVPFAQYVNVGLSQKGQPWLSVPKDIDTRVTTSDCRMETPVISQKNCRNVNYDARTIEHPAIPEKCWISDQTEICSPATAAWTEIIAAGSYNACDNVYGPEQKVCQNVTTGSLTTWQGCVGSRDHPLNVKDSGYGKRIPGLIDVSCGAEVQPLTADRNKLKAKMDALTPSGDTYLPEGIMWGVRMLTKQAPFSESKAKGKGGSDIRKALVLMTDGVNTISPTGAYHTGSDTAKADDYTLQACNEAKAQDLEVFTISFGNAVSSSLQILLESCATTPSNFFNARSSADLKSAFEGIANELLSVRLTQ